MAGRDGVRRGGKCLTASHCCVDASILPTESQLVNYSKKKKAPSRSGNIRVANRFTTPAINNNKADDVEPRPNFELLSANRNTRPCEHGATIHFIHSNQEECGLLV